MPPKPTTPGKPTAASGKSARAKASAATSVVTPITAAPSAAGSASAVPDAPVVLTPDRICVRVGVNGPVGAGKTTLVAAVCRVLRAEYALAVVTNEAQTREDADYLLSAGVLGPDRVLAVQTGCSPQTAIREDIAVNLDAVEALEAALHPLDLLLVESGGGDLTATFSSGLIDRQIFLLDAAGGTRSVRKGGPGVTRADLLVVNKTDLAGLAGTDLEAMRRDAGERRASRPTLFTSLTEHPDAPAVADWIRGLIEQRRTALGRG